MTLERARTFMLANPEAAYKGHAKHAIYLQAVEVVERYKRCKLGEWASVSSGVEVLDNPRFNRMKR